MKERTEVTYEISEEVQHHLRRMAFNIGKTEGEVIERLVMQDVTGDPFWTEEDK